jgi:DNA-binding NtrC family response regulator
MSNKIIAKDEAMKCYAKGKKILAVDTEENLTYTLDELLPEECTYILVDDGRPEKEAQEETAPEETKAKHRIHFGGEAERETLQKLLEQHEITMKQIADYFGVSEQTIRNAMKKWGMTRGI